MTTGKFLYSGAVYNLSVDEDESYIAGDVVVHNCVALPIVPLASKLGVKQPQLEDGEEWFRRQPVGVQKSMMGPSKWRAWQDGAIEFSDLTHKHDDPVYGEMLTEASLVSLLGENAKAYYKVHP